MKYQLNRTAVVLVASLAGVIALAFVPSASIHLPRSAATHVSAITKAAIPAKQPAAKSQTPAAKPDSSLVPPVAQNPCNGKTLLNIVPHQDDDLLFINPTIQNAITAGYCVRTVYLTAGEDGRGTAYMLSREQGAEAAYQTMAATALNWNTTTVSMNGRLVTEAVPLNDAELSLVFLRLPDGNLDGSGFPSTGHVSLAKLLNKQIPSLSALDNSSSYSRQDLINTIAAFITTYQPSSINTLGTTTDGDAGSDHSDHLATGDFVDLAAQTVGTQYVWRVTHYRGYSIAAKPANLDQSQTAQKAAAFFTYAKSDPGVCLSVEQCTDEGSSYGDYLSRQYSFTDAQ